MIEIDNIMVNVVENRRGLNEVQLMLLRMFDRGMSDKELSDIRKLLLDYYEKELHEELEQVIEQKGYTQQDFDNVLNESQRTSK